MTKTIRILNEPGKRIYSTPTNYMKVKHEGKSWLIKMPDKPSIMTWPSVHKMGKEQHKDYPLDGMKGCMYESITTYEYVTE